MKDSLDDWYEFSGPREGLSMGELDVVLMRKDPPFVTNYIFATYILEQALARVREAP